MSTQEQFINVIGPMIQKEAFARGYKTPSAIIAQACLESAYGASLLSAKYHNYFGMKCGSSWKGKSVNLATKEEYNSQLVSIRDNFRVYDSMEEGVKGYFDFISTKRYSNLKDATTSFEYLSLIKTDGYATSSSYVTNTMKVVNTYDLVRFDKGAGFREITPALIISVIKGEYGNGAAREAKVTSEGYDYKLVRTKINELNKVALKYKAETGDYYEAVARLMLL